MIVRSGNCYIESRRHVARNLVGIVEDVIDTIVYSYIVMIIHFQSLLRILLNIHSRTEPAISLSSYIYQEPSVKLLIIEEKTAAKKKALKKRSLQVKGLF